MGPGGACVETLTEIGAAACMVVDGATLAAARASELLMWGDDIEDGVETRARPSGCVQVKHTVKDILERQVSHTRLSAIYYSQLIKPRPSARLRSRASR